MSLPSPLRPLRCSEPDCTLGQGGRCTLAQQYGNPEQDCPQLEREQVENALEEVDSPSSDADESAPWSGRHLGPGDLSLLSQRAAPRRIAILGAHNAGKSSLLTSFFLQLATGQSRAFPYRFASSLTLVSLGQLVSRAERWQGAEGDEIVGHTPKAGGSDGAWLHLGLKPDLEADDRCLDIILTDVAGEHFKDWSERPEAVPQLQYLERVGAFLVLQDSAALRGPEAGKKDGECEFFLSRIASLPDLAHGARFVAVVFSKFDLVVRDCLPPGVDGQALDRFAWGVIGAAARRTWAALEDLQETGVEVRVFACSAFPHPLSAGQPIGVIAPFAAALEHLDSRAFWAALGREESRAPSSFDALRYLRHG